MGLFYSPHGGHVKINLSKSRWGYRVPKSIGLSFYTDSVVDKFLNLATASLECQDSDISKVAQCTFTTEDSLVMVMINAGGLHVMTCSPKYRLAYVTMEPVEFSASVYQAMTKHLNAWVYSNNHPNHATRLDPAELTAKLGTLKDKIDVVLRNIIAAHAEDLEGVKIHVYRAIKAIGETVESYGLKPRSAATAKQE